MGKEKGQEKTIGIFEIQQQTPKQIKNLRVLEKQEARHSGAVPGLPGSPHNNVYPDQPMLKTVIKTMKHGVATRTFLDTTHRHNLDVLVVQGLGDSGATSIERKNDNMSSINHSPRPDTRSPRLHLAHPTDQENIEIWKVTSDAWKDCLSVDMYIKEATYLMAVPLARNGGMSQWVLVDKNLPPDQRPLLASCETFRKRSWISDSACSVTETITHGVASVFTDAKFRGQGYASRLMTEFAAKLHTWQTEMTEWAASIHFSGIGKEFYSNLGWHAFPSHSLEFEPSAEELSAAVPIFAADLEQLCEIDEVLARKALSAPSTVAKVRLRIVPDYEHMLWHWSSRTRLFWSRTCRSRSCKRLFWPQKLRLLNGNYIP
ncbi:uncharacterized protein N7479_004770 [Penicillium vulpinum]|uniref:uncharacterized protein n=1 Tax=Penicillium vulpinum TaxID=29845 RepID=UPI0025490FEF|nr:uncharacterized protein N7479_004770 [Penicillium vulpinum]KAJ5964894.1 hypothetical protein N7479_004770 [Penicillium vulpinum]